MLWNWTTTHDRPSGIDVANNTVSSVMALWKVYIGTRMVQATMAICAGLLVLISVAKYKSVRSQTNIIVSSMALSDMLHGLALIIAQILSTQVMKMGCILNIVLQFGTLYLQVTGVTLLAVERWNSLQSQMSGGKSWSMVKVSTLVAVSWFILFTWNVSMLIIEVVDPGAAPCSFDITPKYYVYITITYYVVASLITLFYFGSTTWVSSSNQIQQTPHNDEVILSQQRRADIRITNMMALVAGVTLGAYLPYTISVLQERSVFTQRLFGYVAMVVLDINFWVKPVIYSLCNQRFNKAFKYIMTSCFNCCLSVVCRIDNTPSVGMNGIVVSLHEYAAHGGSSAGNNGQVAQSRF